MVLAEAVVELLARIMRGLEQSSLSLTHMLGDVALLSTLRDTVLIAFIKALSITFVVALQESAVLLMLLRLVRINLE